MSRRGTLSAALAVLLTTIAVLAPPSMALYSKGSGLFDCWQSTGNYCFLRDCLFPGIQYKNFCTGAVVCVCSSGGIAPTASLGPGGHVQVSGHAVCTEGAVADLRVTITQHGTGAVAE